MNKQVIYDNRQGVLNIMEDIHTKINDSPYVEKNLLTYFNLSKTEKIILWYIAVHNTTTGGDRFVISDTIEAFVLETSKYYYIIDIYCSGLTRELKDEKGRGLLGDGSLVRQQQEGENWFDKFDARWERLESPTSLTKLDLLTLQQQIEELLKQ